MAAPQWSGGKCKSVQQAKAFLRHNSIERRKETQHTNPHIDKSKTHLNYSVKGLTYEQRCAAYDARMGEIDQGRQSTGKNARVVMQSVIVYPPAGLVGDKAKLKAWFMRAGEVAGERFGKNMIDMAVDVDEVHEYTGKDGQKRTSLEHGHLWLVPEVGGKLNGKAFSRRAVINGFNAELQEMSIREFGTPMMDGSQAKGGQTVEQLKAKSEAARIVAEAEAEAARVKAAVEAEVMAMGRKMGTERQALNDRERALEAREQALQEKGRDVQARAEEAARASQMAAQAIQEAKAVQDAYEVLSGEYDDMRDWMSSKPIQDRRTGSRATMLEVYERSRRAPVRTAPTPEDLARRIAELNGKYGDLTDAATRSEEVEF